jgi:uncharacterized protein
MGASRLELPRWESIDLLASETVGRLCVIDGGYPLAFPINYRVVHTADGTDIAFRTAPQTAIARYEGLAALEVDQIDSERRNAWSVIVRGTLRRVHGAHDLPDTRPLLTVGRTQWMALHVTGVSGRRFVSRPAADGFIVEWQPAEEAGPPAAESKRS